MAAMSASHNRAAGATRAFSTACRSKVERLITLRTSAVAVCCSSASASCFRASPNSRLLVSSCCSNSASSRCIRPARVITFVPVERSLRPGVWFFAPLRDKVTPAAGRSTQMLPVLTSKTITWQGRRCLSHLCGCRRRKQDITTRREEQTLTVPTAYLVLLYFLPVAAEHRQVHPCTASRAFPVNPQMGVFLENRRPHACDARPQGARGRLRASCFREGGRPGATLRPANVRDGVDQNFGDIPGRLRCHSGLRAAS